MSSKNRNQFPFNHPRNQISMSYVPFADPMPNPATE